MDKKLLLGESKYIEYKKQYTKTLLKTVSAFANYHDGHILIGVDDNGGIVGIENVDEQRLNIENAINDAIEPKPYYEFETETVDNKSIVVIKVNKGEHTPYIYKDKAYKRMDTSTVQVDRLAYGELILLGRNQSFETLKSEVEDLDFKVLSSRLKAVLNIRSATEDLLKTLGLLDSNGYNNAALLLADNNPLIVAKIELVAYNDHTVRHIKDRQELSGVSIIEQFDKCIDFYHKHFSVAEIIEGAYRKTVEEIPLVAYREAIANAIIHRDYFRDSSIKVEVFEDRVEIISPGSLPIGLSEEEFRNGNISRVRNTIIADVLLRLKIIEKLGTGIRRIKEYYQEYEVEPSFEIYENSIKVILPKIDAEFSSVGIASGAMRDALSVNEREILHLLENGGSFNRHEIEMKLGLKRTQTGDLLKKLRGINLVVKIGSGSQVRYKLNQ